MDDFDLAVSSDGSTDPALLKSRRGNAHCKIRQQRIDEAMQEDGVDSIVVSDKSVWFHGRVVAGAVLSCLQRLFRRRRDERVRRRGLR